MKEITAKNLSTFQLASLLDDLAAGCDPEFDAAYEELDREFAERRLWFGQE